MSDYTNILRLCVKVHLHVTSAFAYFFDLYHPFLENANVKCEHNQLLP